MQNKISRRPIVISFLLAISTLALFSSCGAIARAYLDSIATTYPEIRNYLAGLPPASDIPMARVEEAAVPGPLGPIKVRVFFPPVVRPNAPLLLYIHGGGFVIGSYTQVDRVTRTLARDAQCVVVSTDYALAPEHPFPAGLADCEAVFDWLAAHPQDFPGAKNGIVVGGESAGANFSAVLCLKRRDEGKSRPAAQLLFSPPVGGIDPATGARWPSYTENAEQSLLTPKSMQFFGQAYLGDPAKYRNDPYVNPLYAPSLAGLPPALVVTCGQDPLRDEGEAYAARLKAAGVKVTAKRFENRDHAYQGPEVMALAKGFLGSLSN